MKTSRQWNSPLLLAACLTFSSSLQPAMAQRISDPVIQGFLGSQNSRLFFKEGRRKLKQEIKHLERADQVALEQLLQVNPDASIQEGDIQELESMVKQERKRDR